MTGTSKRDSSVTEDPEIGPSGLWQTRYFQVLLMFLGFSLAYALRISMSVAYVAMIDSASANPDFKEYDWDDVDGYILSSFFWGYTVTQIPAAHVAKYWSPKKILVIGLIVCAVINILVPIAADGGWYYVCACRVGMGLCQGCLLPCMHTLLSSWAPPSERARLVTWTYSGPFFGTVLGNAISGALAASAGGWPSIFYVFSGMMIFWSIIFLFIGADTPSSHLWISEEEKHYIESSLGKVNDQKLEKESNKTPWRIIFKSAPVWALVAAHCGQNWGFWVIITEISIYMKFILGFDIAENGFKAALPYLTMLLLAFPVSWLSDYAVKKGVRKVVLRKLANTISQWIPALALVGMCFTGNLEGTTIPVIIFIVAVGANVGATCGFQMNHIDLSPNNAGILMSITNGTASIFAIIAPLVVSAIVTNHSDFAQWQIVFYLSAAIYFVSNSIFLLLGSAELQWWDDPNAVEAKMKAEFKKTSAAMP